MHVRISRIKDRTADMLIVRGVNLYPSQIEDVLMSFPEVATTYQIHVGREGSLDTLTVKVELYPKMFDGDLRKLKRLEADLTKSIQDEIVVRSKVEFHEPVSLPRSEGKAVRVVDLRREVLGSRRDGEAAQCLLGKQTGETRADHRDTC
jgi:phenylacetate-CoA ligase